jgi:hypothetical protein
MADEKPADVAKATKGATVVFEHSVERVGDVVWRHLKHRPYLGVALTSAAALTLASLVGVGELAFACLAGYGMFKILRLHEPPSQAFREVAEIENKLGL